MIRKAVGKESEREKGRESELEKESEREEGRESEQGDNM